MSNDDVEQHVAEVLQLLGLCAKLAPTFDESKPLASVRRVLAEMRGAIEALWAWLAANASAEFEGASVDTENPGYIKQGAVIVPFYLLEDLPGTTELAEFAALGVSLGVTDNAVICLSGSRAFLGAMRFVGDIDYCEYAVPGTCSTADVVASASAHAVRSLDPLCERVKVMNPTWSRSCDTSGLSIAMWKPWTGSTFVRTPNWWATSKPRASSSKTEPILRVASISRARK